MELTKRGRRRGFGKDAGETALLNTGRQRGGVPGGGCKEGAPGGVYRSVPQRTGEQKVGRQEGRKAGRNLGWAGLETDCRLAGDWLEPFGASRLELGCWRQWTGDWRQAGPGQALAGNLEKRAVARGRGWAPETAAASQWFRAALSGGARLGATGTTSLPSCPGSFTSPTPFCKVPCCDLGGHVPGAGHLSYMREGDQRASKVSMRRERGAWSPI